MSSFKEKDLMLPEKTSRIAIIPVARMITEKASAVQTHYSKKQRLGILHRIRHCSIAAREVI
jgi:hypothetical protein